VLPVGLIAADETSCKKVTKSGKLSVYTIFRLLNIMWSMLCQSVIQGKFLKRELVLTPENGVQCKGGVSKVQAKRAKVRAKVLVTQPSLQITRNRKECIRFAISNNSFAKIS
jgi:hypothetical protein